MVISKQIINGFIKTELEIFKSQFTVRPVPQLQDIRGMAIAWACYYFKDHISRDNVFAITRFLYETYSSDYYGTHGWHMISTIEAAAFILTSDTYYADRLIQNIGCEYSLGRLYIISSAGFICPLISFENEKLKQATEYNVKRSHGWYEENVIVFLLSKGNSQEKIDWLENQIKLDVKNYHTKFFNELKTSGEFFKSSFFLSQFDKAKSYFIFKALSEHIYLDAQLELFDEFDFDFEELMLKEKSHPLSDCYIDFSFLNGK